MVKTCERSLFLLHKYFIFLHQFNTNMGENNVKVTFAERSVNIELINMHTNMGKVINCILIYLNWIFYLNCYMIWAINNLTLSIYNASIIVDIATFW